jgi:GDP-L-fucose synthase
MIQNNIIHQSYIHGVKKLLFLGSSCIYPKNCPQPIKEDLKKFPIEDVNDLSSETEIIEKLSKFGILYLKSHRTPHIAHRTQ